MTNRIRPKECKKTTEPGSQSRQRQTHSQGHREYPRPSVIGGLLLLSVVSLCGEVFAVPTTAPAQIPKLPASLDLDLIRAIPVQHDGRWPPLDTLAREIVESVTGEVFYQGHDPLVMLLAWTFDPGTWKQTPLISISTKQLRGELDLPASRSVFSYAELVDHPRLQTLIQEVFRLERGCKLDPLQSKVRDINEKLVLLQRVFHGDVIKPIPHPSDVLGTWRSIAHPVRGEPEEIKAAKTAWAALGKAFLTDDAQGFDRGSKELISTVNALPAAHRPESRLIAVELRYNRLRPFRTAWIVMIVGAVLSAAAMLVRRKWFDFIAVIVLVAGFGTLTYGLSLRWQIAGRIPAANMFESLLFLSWGMGAFAILSMLFLRHRIVPLTASGMGALSLILADCLPIDHYVRPIAPVLMDTIWMSIHVPVTMVSYSVLALAALIAHVQLIVMASAPRQRQFIDTVDSLHYWYVYVGSFFLLAGIITGSMWAASSWGRYWGWDPKEVWSLIAFLGYLAILHVRLDRRKIPPWAYATGGVLTAAMLVMVLPKLAPSTALLAFAGTVLAMIVFVVARGQFAIALKSILAFWLIVMTYVGVNYVLGIGLHSYGFGTGAVVRYMLIIGAIDLLVVGLCFVVYAVRGGLQVRPVPATQR